MDVHSIDESVRHHREKGANDGGVASVRRIMQHPEPVLGPRVEIDRG